MDISTFNAGKLTTAADLPVAQDVVGLGNNSICQVSMLDDSLKTASNVGKIFFLIEPYGSYQKDTFYKLVQKDGIYEFITLEEDNKTDTIFTFADGSQYAKQETGQLKRQYLINNGWVNNDGEYLSSIVEVQFGNSLTAIGGPNLLSGCASLTAVEIPLGISTLDSNAFRKTGLYSVDIPGSISYIMTATFVYCNNLSSVRFNEGLETIGSWSFGGTPLQSIICPTTLRKILTYAFYGCSSLTSIEFNYGLLDIQEAAFYNCSSLTSITVPSTVTNIGKQAFQGCRKLSSVTFEGNAPIVGDNPFRYVASGCKAYVHSTATEFPAEGEQWNGLTIAYIENT